MPLYRVIFLDGEARNSKPPLDLTCADDHHAAKEAKQFATHHDVEVWRGPHLIELVPRRR